MTTLSNFQRAAAVAAIIMILVPATARAQAVKAQSRGAQKAAVPGVGTAADVAAVTAAARDYIEGFYQGDSTKLVRSVARDVYKYGYSRRAEGYAGSQMQYEGFMSFARGVKQGRNLPPAGAPQDIQLFEVQDQVASVKITAWWGIDYLLLAKRDGRWMITHVTWQSPPKG